MSKRKLKNGGQDRPKAILGAIIPAAISAIGSIAGSISNSNAQKRIAEQQAAEAERQRQLEENAQLTKVLNMNNNAQKAYQEQFRTSYAKGGRRKLRHGIRITDGGYAIPLGNDTFLLQGSSHQDINEAGKTGIGIKTNNAEIEAQGGEVIQRKDNQLRIFSNVLDDNGETPAQEVLEGKNKDKVFARQQAKNGGSSPVEGMRTKADTGLGAWLDWYNNTFLTYNNPGALGYVGNLLTSPFNLLDYYTRGLTPAQLERRAETFGLNTGIAPVPGRTGGYRPNTAQISRWTQQAQRVNQAARRSMARTPAPATITHRPRILNAMAEPNSMINSGKGYAWVRNQPFEQIGYQGSRLGRLNRDVYNLTHYGQNGLRNSLRFPLRARLGLAGPNAMRNLGTYGLYGVGSLAAADALGWMLYTALNDNNNIQANSSSLVSPETNRVINSPVDTLVAPRNSSTIGNDSILVNNPDSVLDADTIAAMTDSINSVRDTVSNARAAIRRMGTDSTRTSRPDSTTISNTDTIARIRQAALQEIMSGNPDGPNNRQLNAMVNNGTIETAFGNDEPVAPTNTSVARPTPTNTSATPVVAAAPARNNVSTPADDDIVRELERIYDNTPTDQIGRDAINRSAADYPYLTGNVTTPPSNWDNPSYDEGPTWNRYGNYVAANKEMNETANRIIASQKEPEQNNTRSFDIGADFKPVDFINAGIGVAGSLLSHIITRNSLNGLERYAPNRPTLYRAGKLVTDYNITPQLAALERAKQQAYTSINSDVASSPAAIDKRNTAALNAAFAMNELYGTKYNKQAELLNEDTKNQQDIDNKTVELYNQHLTDRRNYNAALANRRSLNNVGLIQGIGSSLSNMIQAGVDRYDNNNEIGVILSAAYPESVNYIRRNNKRLARRLGIS